MSYSLNSGFIIDGLFFFFSAPPFSTQLSQPAVSIEGQVSNPPSTSSTEVSSQAAPEKQPSQEVRPEPKMEVEAPEPADTQPEGMPEVRGGQSLPFGVRNMLQERTLILRSHFTDFHMRKGLELHPQGRVNKTLMVLLLSYMSLEYQKFLPCLLA